MSEPIEPLLSELKSMNKKLSNLDEDVNRIDRDLSSDRKDIDGMNSRLIAVEGKLESVLNSLTRFQIKTKEAVSDAVAESTSPMREQMEQFVDKKVIRVKVPTDKWTAKVLALIHKFKGRG